MSEATALAADNGIPTNLDEQRSVCFLRIQILEYALAGLAGYALQTGGHEASRESVKAMCDSAIEGAREVVLGRSVPEATTTEGEAS